MLNQDYKDILQNFLKENVEFLIVGAYALSKHGLIRATGDIDLFVNPTLENSKKIYKALVNFGAPLHDVSEDTFEKEGIVFQIGIIPRRIDIITQIDGVSFSHCWNHRELVPFEHLNIPIISLEDLILNKNATGRTKDKADVEWLEENIIKKKPD